MKEKKIINKIKRKKNRENENKQTNTTKQFKR
jgi:hypothetical protein